MLPLADSRDRTVDLVLDPLRVVAFNTAEGWMRDVTADIAREVRFRGAGGRVRARPSPNANGDAIVSRHLRRQLRRRDASKAAPVHTPVPAMSRPSCVMGCRSHERTYRQARALCHLIADRSSLIAFRVSTYLAASRSIVRFSQSGSGMNSR